MSGVSAATKFAGIVLVLLVLGAGVLATGRPAAWSGLAVTVAVIHGLYLVYQLFGGLLAFVDRRWLVPHVASLTWGVTVVASQWRCPLTMLEKTIWAKSGEAPYSGSFLDHYVYGALLPDGSQPWAFAVYLGLVLAIYTWLGVSWSRVRAAQPDRA